MGFAGVCGGPILSVSFLLQWLFHSTDPSPFLLPTMGLLAPPLLSGLWHIPRLTESRAQGLTGGSLCYFKRGDHLLSFPSYFNFFSCCSDYSSTSAVTGF